MDTPRSDSIRACLAAACALSGFGLLEWTMRRPAELPFFEALAVFSLVAGVYGVVGLCAAAFQQLDPIRRGSLPDAVAAAAGLFLPLFSIARSRGAFELIIFAAAGVAVAVFGGRAIALLPVVRSRLAPWVVGWLVLGTLSLWTSIEDSHPRVIGRLDPNAPSVLLVTLDTTRSDRLGIYGHASASTPVLDALAREGAWFSNAQAQSAWTAPSHATILSGLAPREHGLLFNGETISPGVTSIVDIFAQAGYPTAAFVSGFPLVGGLGFRSAFDVYDDNMSETGFPRPKGSELVSGLKRMLTGDLTSWRRDAEATSARAIRWLDAQRGSPYFVWLHYFDPHLPYLQRPVDSPTDGRWYSLDHERKLEIAASPEAMDHMLALYDAQVTYADRWLGRVIEHARDAAPGDLWIIVTADHGESFGEHDLYFDRDSYEITSRVPLIIVPPESVSFPRGRRDELVGSIDIAPTILAAVGLEPNGGMSGTRLDRVIRDRTFFRVHQFSQDEATASISVRTRRHHLIERIFGREGRFFLTKDREVYDVIADPSESTNLAGAGLEAEARLLRELEVSRLAETLEGHEASILDEESLEALRALGYVE